MLPGIQAYSSIHIWEPAQRETQVPLLPPLFCTPWMCPLSPGFFYAAINYMHKSNLDLKHLLLFKKLL